MDAINMAHYQTDYTTKAGPIAGNLGVLQAQSTGLEFLRLQQRAEKEAQETKQTALKHMQFMKTQLEKEKEKLSLEKQKKTPPPSPLSRATTTEANPPADEWSAVRAELDASFGPLGPTAIARARAAPSLGGRDRRRARWRPPRRAPPGWQSCAWRASRSRG